VIEGKFDRSRNITNHCCRTFAECKVHAASTSLIHSSTQSRSKPLKAKASRPNIHSTSYACIRNGCETVDIIQSNEGKARPESQQVTNSSSHISQRLSMESRDTPNTTTLKDKRPQIKEPIQNSHFIRSIYRKSMYQVPHVSSPIH
jgi:hypothetical protein